MAERSAVDRSTAIQGSDWLAANGLQRFGRRIGAAVRIAADWSVANRTAAVRTGLWRFALRW